MYVHFGQFIPLQHITSSGIPFYVSPISDTLKMCLGTPEIAHNLVRYPVIPKREFKYVHVCGVCVCVCVYVCVCVCVMHALFKFAGKCSCTTLEK